MQYEEELVTIHHSEVHCGFAIFVNEVAPRTFEVTIQNLRGHGPATDALRHRVDSSVNLRFESLEGALTGISHIRQALDALLAYGNSE
jgi:hypothetical protein